MNQVLHYLLESGVCLLVFYLLYILALKRETCFTYNRFYLLLTPLLAFLLPLLELPFLLHPEPLTAFISNQLPTSATAELMPITYSTNTAYPVAEVPVFNFTILLLLLYAAGVI